MNLLRLALVAGLSAMAGAHAAEPALPRLAWLAGCWKADPGEAGSVEHWLPAAGGNMLGVSRTVRQGKTVAYEFTRITEGPDGMPVFHAMPSGQSPSSFPAVKLTDREVVFENLAHDFPQRVVYAVDGDRLNARIEGQRNGQARVVPFPMQRVSCDAALK